MKNRVIQIAKGNIDIEKPELLPEKESLTGIVMPDKKMTVEVALQSVNHVPMHLFFYATDPRITVSKNLTVATTGKLNVEIDTFGLQLGDVISGEVDIVYNGGEKSLPYHFTVGMAKDGENEYLFDTLPEFRAFAEQDPKTAGHIFAWKEFLTMPFMHDVHLQGLYHTYYATDMEDAGLSEFLKAAGVPLPEPEKPAKDAVSMKRYFTPVGLSAREESRTRYLVLSAFLKVEMMFESGMTVTADLKEIRDLMNMYPDDTLAILFYAYVLMRTGETLRAKEMLLKVQDEVQKERLEKRDIYCLFLYLASSLQEDSERIDSTVRLIKKYWTEGTCSLLLAVLLYHVSPEFAADYKSAAEFLRMVWFRGLKHTPVLFETVKLWGKGALNIDVLSDYELTATLYGIRKGFVTERKLFEILGHELKNPAYLTLYMEVLKEGYYRFKNIELLQAIMNVFMQRKQTGPRYFPWYKEAVGRGMTIQGLYECYMLSLPRDFKETIPLRVVEYFGYGKADRIPEKALLYNNVLTKYWDDPRIQEMYDEKIEEFALVSMREEVYNMTMKPIYETILDKTHLDETTAKYMLELFSLYEVETSLEGMKRIIIHYPQLEKEDSYPLLKNKAMVPVFSEEAILAVEDEKGRRHFDENLRTALLFDYDELRKEAALYIEDSLLLKLREADRIVREGVLKDRELFMVTDFITDKRIVPFYRSRLYEKLIDLSLEPSMRHIDCTEFLLAAEYKDFTKAYKTKLLKALIDKNMMDIAVEKAVTYGVEDLPKESLLKLMEAAVNMPLFQGNSIIIAHCFRLFKADIASAPIMQFLATYFRGSVRNMLSIIRLNRKRHHDTKDMVERAFIMAFFTDNRKDLDALFDMYLQETVRDDTIIRAYLTERSHEYFVSGRKMTENCVEMLKKYVRTLPNVAAMALIQWYSEKEYGEEDIEDIKALLDILIGKNIYLGCFGKFLKMPGVPFELLNRMYIEYRDPAVHRVMVTGQVMPGQHAFHRVLTEIYPGVFVLSFILYKREWLQYTFRLSLKDGSTREEDGKILPQEDESLQKTGRIEDLLTLERRIKKKEDRETAEALRGMLLKERMTEEIFGNKR